MLSSWGGMLQHLWSLPISMSLTRPNHIIGDTTRSAAFSHHTHTHNTQTHTQHICTTTHTHRHTHNTCIPQFTHTQAQYRDTYTQTHIQHMHTHTHTHTHTQTGSSWGQGPCLSCFNIPVRAPGRAWRLVGIPLLSPGPSSLTSRLVSAPTLCALLPSM